MEKKTKVIPEIEMTEAIQATVAEKEAPSGDFVARKKLSME